MNQTRSILLRSTSPVWTAGAGASLFFGWPIALIIIGGILVVCALAGIFAVIVRRNGPDETPSDTFSPPPSGPGDLLDGSAGYPEAPDAETAFSPLPPDALSGIHEADAPIGEGDPVCPPETMPTDTPDNMTGNPPDAAPNPAPDTAPNEKAPEEAPEVHPVADFVAEAAPVPEAEPVSPVDPVDEINPGDISPSSDGE